MNKLPPIGARVRLGHAICGFPVDMIMTIRSHYRGKLDLISDRRSKGRYTEPQRVALHVPAPWVREVTE